MFNKLDEPLVARDADSDFDTITITSTPSPSVQRALPDMHPDDWLRWMYQYYCARGWRPGVLAQITQVVIMALVVGFFFVLACAVDYRALARVDDLADALRWSVPHIAVVAMLLAATGAVAARVVMAVYTVRAYLAVRVLLRRVPIADHELAALPWHAVLERVFPFYGELQGHDTALTIPAMAARLLRHDHFFMLMARQTSLCDWGGHSLISRPFLWGFALVIRPLLEQPLDVPAGVLRARSRVVGLLGLVCAPVTVVLVAIYYACRYGDHIHKRPNFLGSRHWSLHAQWLCRAWHEPMHATRARLAATCADAQRYMDAARSQLWDAPVQLGLFVCSSAVVAILALALLDDDALSKTLWGRLVVWWLGVAGAGVALFRALEVGDPTHVNAPKVLNEVATATTLRANDLAANFGAYFEYRVVGFVWEVANVVLTPLFLLFVLPARVDNLLDFIKHNAVKEYGLGWVCAPGYTALCAAA